MKFKYLVLALLTLLSVGNFCPVFADSLTPTSTAPSQIVLETVQAISVTVLTARGSGSGVLKVRDGVSYVWTAGHVVASQRHERQVADAASGTLKIIVSFDDVMVIQDIIENGRKIGRIALDAEIIRYSGVENGEDLAVLRLYKKNLHNSTTFYLDEKILPIGTEMLHVGSMLGFPGANSYTVGALSSVGRTFDGKVFDQTCCTALPGSSGGGIFTKDGKYVGMLVRGASPNFNLIVPIRRMIEWAKKSNIYWTLDDTVPVNLTPHPVENYLEAPDYVVPTPPVPVAPETNKEVKSDALNP